MKLRKPHHRVLAAAFAFAITPLGIYAHAGSSDNKPYVSPVTVLNDNDIFHVHKDGTYTEEETVSLRINDASAIRHFGQSHLVYTKGRETIKVLSAETRTPKGKQIKVPANKIYTQQLPMSSKAPLFGDIKVKEIVFPNVQVGSVLTYHYRRVVTKPLFANEFTAFESLPKTMAFKKARLSITAPEDVKLYVEKRGAIEGGEVKKTQSGMRHWVWNAHDLAAVRREPGSVSPAQVSPFVAISTFPDYKAVAKAYGVKAEKAAAVTPKVQKLADKITNGITDPRRQAKAIYNWVSKNIRYVAIYFGLGGVVPHKADEIIANGYGDCKDHATLLQALLKAKGIQSSQVLINAKNYYALTKTALSTDIFDHCINYLPKYHLFVDATLGQAPFGKLAPQEYGKPVVVVNAGNGEPKVMHIPNATPAQNQAHSITRATLKSNGDVTGKVEYQDTGMFLVMDRKILSSLPDGVQSQVAGRLISRMGVQGSGNLDYNDPDNLAKPLNFSGSFSLPGYADYPGDGALQLPIGIPDLMGMSMRLAHVISLPSRSMPFVCPNNRRIQTIHLTVPKGFKAKLPKAVNFHNALGNYHSTYERKGQVITVNRVLTLNTKNATCEGSQYPQLQSLYSKAIKDLRRQVMY